MNRKLAIGSVIASVFAVIALCASVDGAMTLTSPTPRPIAPRAQA